jgi:hypothetical protein
MFREDYLIRLIKQFAEAIAALAGLRRAGKHQEALAAADRLHGELLTVPREMAEMLDTPALARLLGRPDKMRAAAMLFWEEGHIYKAKGDPLTARSRYKRAFELVLEARAIEPSPDDDGAILELARLVPGRDLDPRYHAAEGA